MLPETRECDAVILYKAVEFPYRWENYKELVKGDKYADSCLLFQDNKWYLFTTAWFGKKNGLRIFVSDELLGNYEEHPMSPITSLVAGVLFFHMRDTYIGQCSIARTIMEKT